MESYRCSDIVGFSTWAHELPATKARQAKQYDLGNTLSDT
jgi:hypothetical protein